MVFSGTPPLMGKIGLLALENGRLLASELATMPATARPEGWEPPRMSCMKKENVPAGVAAVAPTDGAVVVVVAGMSAAGAMAGAAGSSVGVTAGATLGVGSAELAGIWPLGRAVAVCGGGIGWDDSGASTRGNGGVTSSRRILDEVARVVASRSKQKMEVK